MKVIRSFLFFKKKKKKKKVTVPWYGTVPGTRTGTVDIGNQKGSLMSTSLL